MPVDQVAASTVPVPRVRWRRVREASLIVPPSPLHAMLDRISASMGDVAPASVAADWKVDRVRALADAKKFLDKLDLRKRNLVIWVPGTDSASLHPAFDVAVRQRFSAHDTDAQTFEYLASWDILDSMPTGLRALRLVLAALGEIGGTHRVLVAGESQGAWIVGEAVADPLVGHIVSRAAIMGHPVVARTHFDDGHDLRVLELNNAFDKVAMEPGGSRRDAMDAVVALNRPRLHIGDVPLFMRAALASPFLAALAAIDLLREKLPAGLKGLFPDPHNYGARMIDAAAWLSAAPDPTSLPGDPRSWPASKQAGIGPGQVRRRPGAPLPH